MKHAFAFTCRERERRKGLGGEELGLFSALKKRLEDSDLPSASHYLKGSYESQTLLGTARLNKKNQTYQFLFVDCQTGH